MDRWYLDENDTHIYLKSTDDVRWFYNKKELVRILNSLEEEVAKKDEAHMKAMENALNDFLTLRQELNQDKISFAVEQLEKVLKTLEEKQFFKKEDTAYCVHPAQIAEYIDNQIEQIRGEQNEKSSNRS